MFVNHERGAEACIQHVLAVEYVFLLPNRVILVPRVLMLVIRAAMSVSEASACTCSVIPYWSLPKEYDPVENVSA